MKESELIDARKFHREFTIQPPPKPGVYATEYDSLKNFDQNNRGGLIYWDGESYIAFMGFATFRDKPGWHWRPMTFMETQDVLLLLAERLSDGI